MAFVLCILQSGGFRRQMLKILFILTVHQTEFETRQGLIYEDSRRRNGSNYENNQQDVVYRLTLRRLMSYIYIYGAPILDVSRSHTTTQHSR